MHTEDPTFTMDHPMYDPTDKNHDTIIALYDRIQQLDDSSIEKLHDRIQQLEEEVSWMKYREAKLEGANQQLFQAIEDLRPDQTLKVTQTAQSIRHLSLFKY